MDEKYVKNSVLKELEGNEKQSAEFQGDTRGSLTTCRPPLPARGLHVQAGHRQAPQGPHLRSGLSVPGFGTFQILTPRA